MTSGVREEAAEASGKVPRVGFCEEETDVLGPNIMSLSERTGAFVSSLQGTNDPLSALKPIKHSVRVTANQARTCLQILPSLTSPSRLSVAYHGLSIRFQI